MQQICLVELHAEQPAVIGHRCGVLDREAHARHLDVVAALLVEPDRALHQAGDAIQLLRRTRLPDMLAIRADAVRAIDHHREAHTLDLRLLADQRP